MSGMGSLAGYSFTQLTPTQLTPYAVATSSTVTTTTTTSMLQQQPIGSSSTTTSVMLPDDITMKNELPGSYIYIHIYNYVLPVLCNQKRFFSM